MHLMNDKIVTITIKEGDYHEFRIRLPQNPDKTIQTIYRDVDWYRLPYKELASGTVAFLDISGSFILTEHCSDEIVRCMMADSNFPEFDIIMNPVSKSNALAHALATRLYQIKWKKMSGYTVVARSGQSTNKDLEVWYRSVTTPTKKPLHLTDVDADLIKDRKVLLVDDVYARGGTLNACKELVEKAGGEVAGIITIAIEEGCKPIDNLYYLFELPLLKK